MLCGLETTTYYYHHYDPGSFVERQILFINTFPCLFGLAISQYAVYPVATFTLKKNVFSFPSPWTMISFKLNQASLLIIASS